MFLIYFHYLFLLCLSVTVHGETTPTITYLSPTQICDIGTEVDLVCAVENVQDYTVQWMKYDVLPTGDVDPLRYVPLHLTLNSTLFVKDPRFSVQFYPGSSAYYLTIKDIQETDAGWYQCQVGRTVKDKITAEVELQVRRRPVISRNSTRSLVASEGENVQLECYADAVPPAQISWRRQNKAILPTGGSIYRGNILDIPSINIEHRGTYYCVAENGVGKGARWEVNLEVEAAPNVTVEHPKREQALKQYAYLSCHVEAYPPPVIIWYKDGTKILNNQHYSMSHFATEDNTVDTTLRIIGIEESHYGNYTCKAQNKLGSSEGHVELSELLILPEPETSTETADVKSKTSTETADAKYETSTEHEDTKYKTSTEQEDPKYETSTELGNA